MTRRWGVAWLLAAGFILCAAINLPGHLSYDSIMQLNEGRRGFYANWHPPMMSWLLGVFDWVWPGTALFVLFDLALLFGSLAALWWIGIPPSVARFARTTSPASGGGKTARAPSLSSPASAGEVSDAASAATDGGGNSRFFSPAAIVLALCLLTPQFLLYEGIVWKDVLFADLAIAGFAALAFAAAYWTRRRLRIAAIVKCFVLLSVATLVRQNGGVVLPAAIIALGWIAWQQSPARKFRMAAIYALFALIGSSAAVIGMHSALALRIPGDPSPTVQFRLLQFYDLIGALKTDPKYQFVYFGDDDPALEQLMRTDGVALYSPQRNDTLANSARLQAAYFASPDETIPEEWHALIRNHPGLYLRIRTDVFRWVVLTPDLQACRPIFTGIEGPAPQMTKLGLTKRFDLRDAALGYYSHLFVGTPILSHAFFLVLALVLTVALFARRNAADIAIAFMLLSTFAFTASFFVISIACDYRYLYFLDLATLVAAFYVTLDWRSAWAAVRGRWRRHA